MLERIEAEIVVVGGGPAGLAAACCLAEAGRQIVVVDEAPRPGGQIWRHRRETDLPAPARPWLERLAASAARVVSEASVIDVDAAGVLRAEGPDAAFRIRGERLILATGARERFLPFPGWTLPGVVGVGAGQALVKTGVEVDDWRVVLAGSGPLLLPVAALLADRGARVGLIAEQAAPAKVVRFAAGLWRHPGKIREAIGYRRRTLGTPYRLGAWVIAAHGEDHVQEVELTDGRRTWKESCDLLCCSYGLVANTELATLLGCQTDETGVVVDQCQRTSIEGVYCVGEATGIGGAEKSLVEGQLVAAHLNGESRAIRQLAPRRARLQRFSRVLAATFAPRQELARRLQPETIVCRCEDVRWGELDPRWSHRQAKLYTRLGMGPCQARVCGAAMQTLRGWQPDSVRPPLRPCRLSSLID